MRAVNLLPQGDRAQAVGPAPAGSSQVLLGGLAVLVLAMLVLVFSQNQVTDRKQEIAKLTAEQQAAQQRSSSLGSFGQFAEIKQTRVKSISDLAKTRFDWERLMRELALVLPKGTWISSVNASSSGTLDPASGPSPTAAPTDAGGGPSAKIVGCAKSQSRVAETMVRLESLYRAEDVTLAESTGPEDSAAAATAPDSGTTSGGEAAGGEASCGKNYRFTATVAFRADGKREAPGRRGVPSSLGGGS